MIKTSQQLEDYTTEELLAEVHKRITYLKMEVVNLTGDLRVWQDVEVERKTNGWITW